MPTNRTLSDCSSQLSAEESADILYNFLKTSEAKPPEHLENNRMIEGTQPDAYPPPVLRGQHEGTADAYWGQEPAEEDTGSHTGNQHSNAMWDGFKAGREKFLERNFDGFKNNQDQAQNEMGELLQHFNEGEHESGTPFLRDHSKRNPAVVQTVFDRTKKLLDE